MSFGTRGSGGSAFGGGSPIMNVVRRPSPLTGGGGGGTTSSTSQTSDFPGGFKSALDFLNAYNAPQFTQLQNGINQQQSQIPQMQGSFADQIAAARAGNVANLGQLANNTALNGQMMGFNTQLGGLLNRLRDLSGQSHGNTLADIAQRQLMAQQDLNSDATARGAMFTPGTGRTRSNINTMAGLSRERAGIDFAREDVSLDREGISLAKERAQLETQAKNFGLDANALNASLQATLSRLNLDQIISVGNILESINSKNAQESALANSIIEQAVAMAPYMSLLNPPTTPGTQTPTNQSNVGSPL